MENHSYLITLNRFNQKIINGDDVFSYYLDLAVEEKYVFQTLLIELVSQSKCHISDIDTAIRNSGIKASATCCIVLKKGLYYHNMVRLFALQDKKSSFLLLLHLMRIGYDRRKEEPSSNEKWWYNTIN